MKHKKYFGLTVLFALILAFCGCGLNSDDSAYIAKVNGEKISKSEYMYYVALAKEQLLASTNVQNPPADYWTTTEIAGKKAGDWVRESAYDNAVTSTLVAQKAKAAGFDATGSEAKTLIDNVKSQMAEVSKKYGISENGENAAFQKAYLRNKLFEQYKTDGKINVSDEAVSQYYKSNYRTVKHILFLTTDPSTGEQIRSETEAETLAGDTVKKLSAGESFDKLMNSLSEDTGLQSNPGGYTFAKDGSMVAEFEDAAFTLNEGEISAPIKSSFGYHILKREPLISYDEYLAQGETDEQKQNLQSSIVYQVEMEAETKYIDEWKQQSTIERNDSEYSKLEI